MSEHVSTITITNDTACLNSVRELVAAGIQQSGYPAQFTNQVMMAVDEAVANIIEHAYQGVTAGRGQIRIDQTVTEELFQILIEDDGLSFEAEEQGDLDIAAHVAQGKKGGLGIFLMRRIMDVVDYSFEAGVCNRLILMKYA